MRQPLGLRIGWRDVRWKTVLVPSTTETLTGIEALSTALTFVWFAEAHDTTALVEALQAPAETTRWESCAHYVRNYRAGQSPAPGSLSDVELAEAEDVVCTISGALVAFRRLVAAYNRLGPDDLDLFYAYLLSDPACWDDWLESAREVVERAPD